MELYDDQQKLLFETGMKFKAGHKRIIAQAMTGFGKGVVIAEMAIRAAAKGNRVCILVYRKEILQQIFKNLVKMGHSPGLLVSGSKIQTGHSIYLGMVEVFDRKISKGIIEFLNIQFLICDECHIGNFTKVLNKFKGKVVGFTATPKSSGEKELNELYDSIVCGPTASQLIAMKRLSPGKTFRLIEFDLKQVKRRGKEYEEKALLDAFKKAKLYDGMVKKYMELCPERKAICYCVNVQHSMDTYLQFKEAGVKNVYHIDGNTNEAQRDAEFEKFRQDRHAILCNASIATTGTDVPSVRCIMANFATLSIVKYHQCTGRGARIWDGGGYEAPKEDCFIIDAGLNYVRHKAYGQDIEWESIFHNPKKAEPSEKELKRDSRCCKTCGMVIKMRLKVCPYCDTFFGEQEIQEEIIKYASLEEVRQYRFSTLPIHLRRDVKHMTHSELMEYARHMNYAPRWVGVQMNLREKYKDNFQGKRR